MHNVCICSVGHVHIQYISSHTLTMHSKPEPNMLKILPIIPSSTYQKIYPLLSYYTFVLMFRYVLTSRERRTYMYQLCFKHIVQILVIQVK